MPKKRAIKVINSKDISQVEEKKEVKIIKKETSKTCNISKCTTKKHGKFDECKKHFTERHRKGDKYKWSPAQIGFDTIITILMCYSHVYDIDNITINHIERGAHSHIPLTCLDCGYSRKVSIKHLIYDGTSCTSCIGYVPYNIDSFREKVAHRTEIDFSIITVKHINRGLESQLPLRCIVCDYNWCTSMNSLINGNAGCPCCTTTSPYTLGIFLFKMLGRIDIDVSKVTEKDIDNGANSHLPVSCVKCFYNWFPTITSLVNSKKSCPRCAEVEPYTLISFQERIAFRTDIDTSQVTEEDIDNGCDSHVAVICMKCKHKWSPTISSLVSMKNGCPKCRSSRGVKAITQYLDELEVKHKEEKTFKGLVNEIKLRIDVYIISFPEIKLPICIEFDGDYPGSHFHYRDEVEKRAHVATVKRDLIKDDFVLNNEMHMVRIPYTCFKKDSTEMLNATLDIAFAKLKTKKKPYLLLTDKDPYEKRDAKLLED